jgi:hypothetical protein
MLSSRFADQSRDGRVFRAAASATAAAAAAAEKLSARLGALLCAADRQHIV